MSLLTIVCLVVVAVLGVTYVMRRRGRLRGN
jgi:hypothetical protein